MSSPDSLTQEIASWIDQMRRRGRVRFELRCVRMTSEAVDDWELAANDDAPAGESMAQEVLQNARAHGRYQAGETCSYKLLAFKGAAGSVDTASAQFVFEVPAAGKGKGVEESAQNLQAVVGTLAKMVGEGNRILLGSFNDRNDHTDRQMRLLIEQNERDAKSRIDLMQLSERLLSLNVEREKERHDMQLAAERQKMMADKIESLWPIFLNRVSGGGPGKGTPYLGEQLVEKLLGSLDKSQLDSLMGESGLSPDQQMLFAELYMAYGERAEKKKAAAAAKKLNATPASPAQSNGTHDPGKDASS